jgi:uncharacterized protein YfiM (DUF2279 family)
VHRPHALKDSADHFKPGSMLIATGEPTAEDRSVEARRHGPHAHKDTADHFQPAGNMLLLATDEASQPDASLLGHATAASVVTAARAAEVRELGEREAAKQEAVAAERALRVAEERRLLRRQEELRIDRLRAEGHMNRMNGFDGGSMSLAALDDGLAEAAARHGSSRFAGKDSAHHFKGSSMLLATDHERAFSRVLMPARRPADT